MKKLIMILTFIVTVAACYGVYSFFDNRKQARIAYEQEQQALEAARQAEAAKRAEAQRKAEEERLAREREIELQKMERKLDAERRLEAIQREREARQQAQEEKYLQRRIQAARKISKTPEAIPGRMLREIERATYIYIRNNPKDFIGHYTDNRRRGALTTGGANGLMLFAMVGTDLRAIKEVIAIGHNIKDRNKSGHTALMFASAYNIDRVIQFFIDEGADITAKEYLTEGTALHIAARHNPKPEIFDVLVNAGANLEAVDNEGNTPLLAAAKYNKNIQVVERLVALGANINATDNRGDVAYSYVLDRTKKKSYNGAYEKISDELEDRVLDSLVPI